MVSPTLSTSIFLDDTYMYDDAARGAALAGRPSHHQGHWYDEPPYESDPDDFLMSGLRLGAGNGGGGGPAAKIQVSRYCICDIVCDMCE